MMEDVEKFSLSTALPQLIHQIEVNTKFKASLLSSGILEGDRLDSLIERNNGQNLVFKIVQSLKKANQRGGFHEFHQLLRASGQTKAADSLQTELIRHSQRLGELKRARESERPYHLPTEARNSLGVLSSEIAPTARSPSLKVEHVSRTVSEERLSEAKMKLKELLPPRGTRRDTGDVIVTNQYYKDVYGFMLKPYSAPPGPLPDLDTSKPCHFSNTFCFLPPGACALLSRTFGGKVALMFQRDQGHPVLRSSIFQVMYCKAEVFVDPGGIRKCSTWLSVHCSLRESLSHCTRWPDIEGRCHESNIRLDLSMSGAQWYPGSLSTFVRIARKGQNLQVLPKEEKRRILHEHFNAGQDDDERTSVVGHYGKQVVSFATGATDKEPGAFQAINCKAAAHSDHNVSHLPIELSTVLIEMYGGSATLVKGKEHNCLTLDDMKNVTTFVSSIIKLHSGQTVGGFLLAVKRTLADAVAAVIGTFPSRVQTDGIDFDVNTTVRKWFDTSSSVVLVVWV